MAEISDLTQLACINEMILNKHKSKFWIFCWKDVNTWKKSSRRDGIRDCNWTQIQNHLVLKRTLNIIHNVYINYDGRIAISEGIDVNKRSASKNLDIWHYWDFLNKGFKFL